jgi:hypothetical protein
VDSANRPAIEGWDAPTEVRRSPWVRTGFIAAVLWAAIGMVVAFLSAQTGAPTASGWLALLTGPVVLFIIGRRARIHGRGDWIRAGLLDFGVVVVLGSAAIFLATLSGVLGGPNGRSSVESVGFGTGGTDCTLATTATHFSSADQIRVVAEFSPELSTGTVVKIWLSRDGKALESTRQTFTLDASTGCISGGLSDAPLAVGHYRWDISPDTAPAISGDFDVTK